MLTPRIPPYTSHPYRFVFVTLPDTLSLFAHCYLFIYLAISVSHSPSLSLPLTILQPIQYASIDPPTIRCVCTTQILHNNIFELVVGCSCSTPASNLSISLSDHPLECKIDRCIVVVVVVCVRVSVSRAFSEQSNVAARHECSSDRSYHPIADRALQSPHYPRNSSSNSSSSSNSIE